MATVESLVNCLAGSGLIALTIHLRTILILGMDCSKLMTQSRAFDLEHVTSWNVSGVGVFGVSGGPSSAITDDRK